MAEFFRDNEVKKLTLKAAVPLFFIPKFLHVKCVASRYRKGGWKPLLLLCRQLTSNILQQCKTQAAVSAEKGSTLSHR